MTPPGLVLETTCHALLPGQPAKGLFGGLCCSCPGAVLISGPTKGARGQSTQVSFKALPARSRRNSSGTGGRLAARRDSGTRPWHTAGRRI